MDDWEKDAKLFIKLPEDEFVDFIIDLRKESVEKGMDDEYHRPFWDFQVYDIDSDKKLIKTGDVLRVTSKRFLVNIKENKEKDWVFGHFRVQKTGQGLDTLYVIGFCEKVDPDQTTFE